jgi:hypothetical protein
MKRASSLPPRASLVIVFAIPADALINGVSYRETTPQIRCSGGHLVGKGRLIQSDSTYSHKTETQPLSGSTHRPDLRFG